MKRRPTAAVIGAGPAGLMAAETLSAAGVAVTVYERMPSVARKFLMAGRGGLNLTHSEPLARQVTRYGASASALQPVLQRFSPAHLVDWTHALGQPTFVGSSGRVFPRTLKASPLLRAWLERLAKQGVVIQTRRMWTGWSPKGELRLDLAQGATESVRPDVTVLALGGASWPRLGADGGWVSVLTDAGVEVAPLRPANCGFDVAWSPHLRGRFAGSALKTLAATVGSRTVRGELTLTARGVEGGVVYALGMDLREAIAAHGAARLELDLKPDLTVDAIARRLATPSRRSRGGRLRNAIGLNAAAIAVLNEGGDLERLDPAGLARRIKAVPLRLDAAGSIDRAISTAGGVRFAALDPDLELRARPGVFVAGEMLDWEAPTGGYLLQASFATGVTAARGALRHLGLDVGLQPGVPDAPSTRTPRSFTRPVSSA